ncbi:MAG: type I 3-dehydroquinate dehydratase [Streptococcaceae bacterium]|jgi:3-dehydroquinate dehydratase-1|nr:type I 3-dehydroquinate dehydratase [Streptococcaceae bacterium]
MKIIVPFCPRNEAEIDNVDLAKFQAADMIEWRADFLPADKILFMAEKVFDKFKNWPVLFTLRSTEEGGNFDQPELIYSYILRRMLNEFDPAYVDVEAYTKPEVVEELAEFKKKMVFSYHDFKEIPENLIQILSDFADQKPDAIKLAVTAQKKSELWQLLLTAGMFRETLNIPLIVLALGELGKISRVIDNPWTFVRLEENPNRLGQFTLKETQQLLELLDI